MCDSGTSDKKVKVFRVSRPDYPGTSCTFRNWAPIEDELLMGEADDPVTISVIEMTEDELEGLPEFEGW